MKRLVLALLLALWALMALALPTVEEVQAEVAKGNVAHAEEMVRSVVQAKPGSARAHYVYAELLARERRYEQAAEQAALAKSIDPSLQFTQPERFKAFEQLLERERTAVKRLPSRAADGVLPALPQPAAVAESSPGGVPGWAWLLGLGAVAFVAWRALSGRRQAAAPSAAVAGAGGGGGAAAAGMPQPGAPMAGYGPGYGPAGYPPAAPGAAGRSWLGTGLAAAGGVAAGMMAERMLHGHQDQGLASSPSDAPGLRGMAPGLLGGAPDDESQRELDQRPVDFGTGGDWGGDDAGAGDGGSSSSDDGW